MMNAKKAYIICIFVYKYILLQSKICGIPQKRDSNYDYIS